MRQPLVEKYRPRRLSDFAGFSRIAKILSHIAKHPIQGALFLLGGPGIGKTTMSLAMCEEMGAELHHFASKQCDLEAVQRICDTCHYVPFGGGWHFVLVDEMDLASSAAQNAFLSKLDATAPPPSTLFVFTANSTERLETRFLSRCRILEFDPKGIVDEAAAFLESVWRKEKMPMRSAPNFKEIFLSSGSNFRSALNLLEIEMIAPSEPKMPVKFERQASGLYTIGIEKLEPSELRSIAQELGIQQIVDAGPKGLPQRVDFQRAAEVAGIPWIVRDGLRGRRVPEKRELEWLAKLAKSTVVLLVSRAEAPGRDPRHAYICLPLAKVGCDALHVFQDHLVSASDLQRSIENDSDYSEIPLAA